MRIVVTGASGNVGTALLLQLGQEHELVGVSRRPPPNTAPYAWADWVTLDIGDDDAPSRLRAAMRGADAVVHLAWLIQPSHDRGLMRRTNQRGARAVVSAAATAGVAQFVHQSSVGAYAPAPGQWVDEDWPATGIESSSYSVDKAAAERVVSEFADRLLISTTRPALVFQDAAASEVARYFLGRFVPVRALRRGVVRFAPLSDQLAFQAVHADDVAAAIELILTHRAGGAFNIAAPPVIDRAVFARIFGGVGPPLPPPVVRAVAAATWRLRLQPTEPGWIDLAKSVPFLKTDRLTELGWTAQRDAADVLGRFVDAMQRGAGRPGPLLARRRSRSAQSR